ncbi:MAG TPA: oligosaccharide flippase family protein [Chitinophagales bacterium]
MRKKFVSNISFLLFANLLVKPLWIFGIDRSVQVQAGAVEYGNYFTAMNIAYLLSILLDFGINNFTNRSVSRNNNRAVEFLSNLLPIKVVLAAIYLVVTIVFALLSGIRGWLLFLVLLSALSMTMTSFVLHFRAYVAALHKFRTDSYLSVTDKLIATILVGTLLVFGSTKLPSTLILLFSVAQLFALTITAIIAYNIVSKKHKEHIPQWSWEYTRAMLLHSLPFALLILQMTIYGRIDGFLLNRMLPQGSDETGIYASGFRLLDAATQFGYLAATILLPMFAKAIKEKTDVRPLTSLSALLLIVGATTLAVFVLQFKTEIVFVLYHTNDLRYSNALAILMFTFIPIASNYVFSTLLTANGSLKLLNIFATLGIIINVFLNFLLIPKFSALGAAFSALATQSFIALCNVVAVFFIFRKNK